MPRTWRTETTGTPLDTHGERKSPTPSSSKKERAVGFLYDPVSVISRPVNAAESWAAYEFEIHARKCAYCENPFEVHRNHEQLCEPGHLLAQEVARYIYMASDGEVYSTVGEDHKRVRVELPAGYDQVRGLLKAIERSLRHRNRHPFVAMERTYIVPASARPERKNKEEEELEGTMMKPRTQFGSHENQILAVTKPKEREILQPKSGARGQLEKGLRTLGDKVTFSSTFQPLDDSHKNSSHHIRRESRKNPTKPAHRGIRSARKGTEINQEEKKDAKLEFETVTEPKLEAETMRETMPEVDDYEPEIPELKRREPEIPFSERSIVKGRNEILENISAGFAAESPSNAPARNHRPDLQVARSVSPDPNDWHPGIDPELLHTRLTMNESSFDRSHEENILQSPEDHDPDPDDESSVVSSNDGSIFSIASLKSWATDLSKSSGYSTTQIATATQEVLMVLVSDEVLRPLFVEAIEGDIGPSRFVNNFRRLLKLYSEDLKEEAQDAVQLLAAKLIAIKARYLAHAVSENFQQGAIAPDLDPTSSTSKVKAARDHDDSEEEEGPSVHDSAFEDLNIGREFLVESNCFRQLRSRFQKLVHGLKSRTQKSASEVERPNHTPTKMLTLKSSLREVVDSAVNTSLIQFSSENNTTLANSIKLSVEKYTDTEWDWWPLTPPVPQVPRGMMRLEWKFSNRPIYEIITEDEAEIIQDMLSQHHDYVKECHCFDCRNNQGFDNNKSWLGRIALFFETPTGQWETLKQYLITKFLALIRSRAPGTSSSNSNQSQTSTQFVSSSQINFPNANNSSAQLPSSRTGPTQTTQQASSCASVYVPQSPVRILFGVQGRRWSLELEQIIIAGLSNDPTFFRELKARYKRHRGFIKLLLSPYRFRFCRFVKFEKFDAGRIISQGEDLPDYHGFEHDYEYTPRPGDIPLINRKVFAVCLNACNPDSCTMSLLNPWHDCIRLPRLSDKIRRIPKKKSDFDVSSDDVGVVAWGLEADYAISFAFLAVYHFVPLSATLGFWIYWLTVHPGDLQNAAVPFLTVLALFAAFWVPFSKQLGMS